ncbi:MAG: multicopper oxidase domain-containing protein [Gemmatimonadota bacterium]
MDPKRSGDSQPSDRFPPVSRRNVLKAGALTAAGLATAGAVGRLSSQTPDAGSAQILEHGGHDGTNAPVGRMEGRFDPVRYLDAFDYGRASTLPDGRTLREYEMVAVDRELEVAPGVFFPAWTYNGQVPGPTIRCTEGDRLRIRFANAGSHPHTIHFHGIHAADMDGVFEIIEPGSSYVYEFDAEPFGLHLYHCHSLPLKRHIHKGLYGAFIIDPPGGRPPAREMVMVMNGFDTNFDGENEVYAINTEAFAYQTQPIRLRQHELARVYLVNLTEFDLLNSFHLHGNFFRCYRTGTDLERHDWTDTVALCQGERAVLEFAFKHTGRFMFHAHQSEFAELGWMGIFDVQGTTNA